MWSLHMVAEHLWKQHEDVIGKWGGGIYYPDRECTNAHAQTGLRSAVTTPLIRESLASFISQRYMLPPPPSPRLLRVLDSERVIQTDEPTQDGGRDG